MDPIFHRIKIFSKKWQAWQDSNLQHAVLETAALASSSYRPPTFAKILDFVGEQITAFQAENKASTSNQQTTENFFSGYLRKKSRSRGNSGCGPCRNPYRNYSMISLTTPAPTVLPPSRTAKRSSFSMATGIINVPSIATLSPGITISVPAGSVTTPVTSVVRK